MSRIIVPGAPMLNLRATNAVLMDAIRRGAITELDDVIVPEIFVPYVQNRTTEKSRLIQSGALQVSERLNAALAGEGTTFTQRFFKDLDRDEENTSSASDPTDSTPGGINSGREIQVRLSRNKSWGSADLTAALAGNDPMNAIANRVADWRVRRLQAAWLATMKGVFATNDAAPSAGSTHIQKDLTLDISTQTGDAAKFSASAFISATGLMGDSMGQLTMVMMHSIVYQQLQRLNLIDFIPDARGEVNIAYYQGREVIVDDGMPNSNGVFHTYLIGAGATALGAGSPKVPVAVKRNEEANNGAGEEILFNRWEWIIHPVGHAWRGTAASKGGPSNIELGAAGTFDRVYRERKMIRIARLITKEV